MPTANEAAEYLGRKHAFRPLEEMNSVSGERGKFDTAGIMDTGERLEMLLSTVKLTGAFGAH